MRKIIHHLRKQPEDVRRHVLHIIVFIAGVILVVFWTFTLDKNFSSSETEIKIQQDLQPFNLLKDSIIIQ